MKDISQAAAGTGRASLNFNGPTIHGAFLWGANCSSFSSSMSPAKKQKLQNFYKDTELFIFDQINACSADMLCQIDETMKELFCAVNQYWKENRQGVWREEGLVSR